MTKYIKIYRVDILEYERGWGSRIEDTKYFKTLNIANRFITKYNSKNNLKTVPDWYMIATKPTEEFITEKQYKKLFNK